MTETAWFANFGSEVGPDSLTAIAARQFTDVLAKEVMPGARFIGARQSDNCSAVHFEVDVERPQVLAHPIRATEPIAVLFPFDGGQPSVLALRPDFPDTNHQNATPPDFPCSLCVDDRPWNEARLTSSAPDLVRRIQLWLAKAAKGELHDPAQPADPIFYTSSLALIIPPETVTEPNAQLSGFLRRDNEQLIITRRSTDANGDEPAFNVVTFEAQPQAMARLRHAPRTLSELANELQLCGIELLGELRTLLKGWAGASKQNARRLDARLAIVVSFPIAVDANRTVNDFRAFVTFDTAGELGMALGVLHRTPSGLSTTGAYMPMLVASQPKDLNRNQVEAAQAHFSFNRELAASIAGLETADRRRAVLIGAGSLGSQAALNLAREGRFEWTVIDDDHLLPHNLARHGLLASDIGAPKALALAGQLGALLGESFISIRADVIRPQPEMIEPIAKAFAAADIVIDASASVAVSRHLGDLDDVAARRVSVFFNPAGTSVVILAEGEDRGITLRDLEAQYHRIVLTEPKLVDHLTGQTGVRYSGSCRSVTNRIPATHASLLSALASRGIADALSGPGASVKVWTVRANGEVELIERTGERVHRVEMDGWKVSYDDGLLHSLAGLREARLPNETGGVLLGIADLYARSIHIAHPMPQPPDSLGTPATFERGVVGVADTVKAAVEATMHQLRYIGEWHSHPRRASVMPSRTDVAQLMWLSDELQAEGLPALMAIAGDDGKYALLVRRDEDTDQSAQRIAGAG